MIDRVLLEGIKQHARTELRLAPLTLIVGPNDSGKTTVLEAIQLVGRLHRSSWFEVFPAANAAHEIARRGHDQFAIELSGRAQSRPRRVRVEARYDPIASIVHNGEKIDVCSWQESIETFEFSDDSSPHGAARAAQIGSLAGSLYWDAIASVVLLRFELHALRAPSPARSSAALGANGWMLATVLANMKLEHEAAFDRACAALNAVIPSVKSVRIAPSTAVDAGVRVDGFELVFDTDSATAVSARHMSEGALRTLALLAVVCSPRAPRVVLIDQLGHSLSPGAQERLSKVLTTRTTAADPQQIIATTSAPAVIDAVSHEAVIAFARAEDGSIAARSFSEHPAFNGGRQTSVAKLCGDDDEQRWVLR